MSLSSRCEFFNHVRFLSFTGKIIPENSGPLAVVCCGLTPKIDSLSAAQSPCPGRWRTAGKPNPAVIQLYKNVSFY